jgi:hypothetical protein
LEACFLYQTQTETLELVEKHKDRFDTAETFYKYMEETLEREAEERERAAAADGGSDSDGNGTAWIAADRQKLGLRKIAREKQKILSAMEMIQQQIAQEEEEQGKQEEEEGDKQGNTFSDLANEKEGDKQDSGEGDEGEGDEEEGDEGGGDEGGGRCCHPPGQYIGLCQQSFSGGCTRRDSLLRCNGKKHKKKLGQNKGRGTKFACDLLASLRQVEGSTTVTPHLGESK